jgi:hypothetical protein
MKSLPFWYRSSALVCPAAIKTMPNAAKTPTTDAYLMLSLLEDVQSMQKHVERYKISF